jgi:hypothetical protein
MGDSMNNTKWREVFQLLANLEIKFAFRLQSNGPFAKDYHLYTARPKDIGTTGITDPGFGGPFSYKDIAELLIPKTYIVIDRLRESSQQKRVITQPMETLELKLAGLGKLPLQSTGEELRILA